MWQHYGYFYIREVKVNNTWGIITNIKDITFASSLSSILKKYFLIIAKF